MLVSDRLNGPAAGRHQQAAGRLASAAALVVRKARSSRPLEPRQGALEHMSEQPTFEPENADEFQLDLRQYWDTILRRRWAIFVFFAVTVSVVALFTTRQPKVYSASATCIIETQAPQVLGGQVQDV